MTDLFDADGYPTTEALDRLRTFDGTASDMLELITELFRPGGVRVERGKDENGRDGFWVYLATMGWSGCEDVIGTLQGTMFWAIFWQKSQRGGGYEFHISDRHWNMEYRWGTPSEKGE